VSNFGAIIFEKFLIFGCRILAGFTGAGFLILEAYSPIADSDAFFHCVLNISSIQEKNRTLNKAGEGCGTQKSVQLHKSTRVMIGSHGTSAESITQFHASNFLCVFI